MFNMINLIWQNYIKKGILLHSILHRWYELLEPILHEKISHRTKLITLAFFHPTLAAVGSCLA